MITCLITGANGFIGTTLVKKAKEAGIRVLAGVRHSSNIEHLKALDVDIVPIDFSSSQTIRDSIAPYQFEYVIHNAGLTKTTNPQDYFDVNVTNTKYFIDALIAANISIQKFVFISSLAAFGPSDLQPDGLVSKSSQPHPVSAYGKSKLAAEKMIQEYKNFPYVFIRPTAVYGPGEKDLFQVFDLVKRGFVFVAKVKNQKQTFVYVEDLCNVILKALTSTAMRDGFFVTDGHEYATIDFPKVIGKVMNTKFLTIPIPIFILRIIAFFSESISKLTKKATQINSDKVSEFKAKAWACDMDYTVKTLGYVPQITLEEGVRRTLAHYQKNNLL